MDNFFANLTAVLSTTPQRWHQITQNFSEDLLRRQPMDGEWCALECLLHLMDTDTVFGARVKAFLAKENFPAYDPDAQGTKLTQDMTGTDLAAQFKAIRTENLKLIATITEADLANEVIHSELGAVNLSNMLHEWGGHDLMHIIQAEHALMQPFIAGCGAWKPYFVEHLPEATLSDF